jgi:hypothetical protein
VRVDEDDLGGDRGIGELVSHDDDLVADGGQPGRRAVEGDDAGTPLPREDVGLEAGARLDDGDGDLLSDKHAAAVDEVGVDGDAPLVIEPGLRDGGPMDLAPEHPTHGCTIPVLSLKFPVHVRISTLVTRMKYYLYTIC